MATPAEERLIRFADAVTRGVAEDAVAECHPDVSFSSVLASVDGEPFRGHEGIQRYFSSVRGRSRNGGSSSTGSRRSPTDGSRSR